VYLTGKKPFKQPNWLGASLKDYNAQRDKDKILNEFNNNPGLYGYGLVAGLQPAGYHILCIDIDIDNDCKELARKRYEEFFQKYSISYHLETTKSGRYHIFFAVDKVSDELKKLIELVSDCGAKKYIHGTEKDGKIEILGLDGRHTVTVYDGIINDEKPVIVLPLNVTSLEYIQQSISKFEDEINGKTQGEFDDDVINKLEMTFRLMRKYNLIDGWKIDSIVSGFCVKNQIPDDKIFEIFKVIFGDEYDEKKTQYIIKKTKEKIEIDLLPGTGSVVYQAKRLLKSGLLSDEETKQVKDFLETIRRSKRDKDDLELREYLEGVEEVYLYSSVDKYGERKGTYYIEEYYIEKEDGGDKEVWYVEIESDEPNAIFKRHTIKNGPKFVCAKVDIKRIIKEKKALFEVVINDEFTYTPSFDFKRLDDLVEEIASECAAISPEFDMPRFKKYLRLKLKDFKRDPENRKPSIISRITGWNDDFSYFYHYDLNNNKHELHKEHTLYRQRKAESFNQEEQHKFVFKLLEEGKLLSVFLTISGSSILLKPLNLQPFTVIITGNPGAGKTTACLIATSLFYKSDEILLTPDTTRVGLELKLASLNSLPFVVDEGALAEDSELLKRLIFGVASKKGRTRGRKDLTVDTKDIISNVFWTSETTDIDEIKRGGAFRRMIHITVESWKDFTELFDIDNMSTTPNELYTGCGVDYIKFAIENLNKIRERFNRETKDFGIKYKGVTGIAKTIYAGIILLEEFYKQHYNIVSFAELRKRVDVLLNEVKDRFQAVKDDVVESFQQYLYANLSSSLLYLNMLEMVPGGYKYAVDTPKGKRTIRRI
jgi:Superfamily II helicase and inactivated derivatives